MAGGGGNIDIAIVGRGPDPGLRIGREGIIIDQIGIGTIEEIIPVVMDIQVIVIVTAMTTEIVVPITADPRLHHRITNDAIMTDVPAIIVLVIMIDMITVIATITKADRETTRVLLP